MAAAKMAAAKEVKEEKLITVYKANEASVTIQEKDLKVWEKAGYTQNPPEIILNKAEQAILLKRAANK